MVAGWREAGADLVVVAGRGPVAELDVRVAVPGVARLHTGDRAGLDEVRAGHGVVLVGPDTFSHLPGTVLLLWLLPSQAGAEEVEAVSLVVGLVQTLPGSLHTLRASLFCLVLRLALVIIFSSKTDIEHGTAGDFIFQPKTFLHLTGAATVFLLPLVFVIIMTLLSLTDTICQHFKTIIKSIIVVAKTFFRLL